MTSNLFCLPNLSSSNVIEDTPWTYLNGSTPKGVTKEEFQRWCAKPTTESLFFSGFEGTHAAMRVSEANPPVFMHAVVADYDSPVAPDERLAFLRRASKDYPPNYISTTFSGQVRLVWVFADRVPVYGWKVTEAFLRKLASELKLRKIFPGLDEQAFFSTSQYYHCGSDWQQLHEAPLPTSLLHSWLLAASKKGDWSRYGDMIPLTRVAEAVEKRFPGRWSGPFDEGARGARFWDDGADNPTAAIVRRTGMQCFTGPKPFVTWGEILGRKFVEQFRADTIGSAIDGIWFDGRDYWRRVDGVWRLYKRPDIACHLRVAHGITDERPQGATFSQMDQVLNQIQSVKVVDGAAPFIYRREAMVKFGAKRYLNIARHDLLKPAEDPQPWGASFPYIAALLDGYFDPPEQLDYFLSWLAYAYQHARAGRPRNGQAIFIAGDVNLGKTLVSNVLVGDLLGGHMDASDYLLGESRFNKELFEVGLWTVDDTVPSSDPRKQQLYSAMLKKIPANYSFRYHPKFRDEIMLPWAGRVIITCNADPESIRILPDVEMSLLDKVMLFQVANVERDFVDAAKRIRAELPAFARFLADYRIPEHCVGDARFGVKCYHHPELVEAAQQSSRTGVFIEILEMFCRSLFGNSDIEEWVGSSSQLLSEMLNDETTKHVAEKYTPEQLGRLLGKLEAQGYPGVKRMPRQNRVRLWRITRDVEVDPENCPF
ncbi:primase-helicase family protein [Haloferula sp. A504]|uniref:primase-helicase family protein n=1 Tax=Haloferula sp. A504 TaxID=3373601 RepID=UPI0031CB3EC3|nr:hypothetical protein [Verrucomicrobiaceae bacterium E54]